MQITSRTDVSLRYLASVFVILVTKQPELRRVARGLSEAEMPEGVRGQEPPARRTLQIAALNQERLDDVFDGVARLGQRRRVRERGLQAPRLTARRGRRAGGRGRADNERVTLWRLDRN